MGGGVTSANRLERLSLERGLYVLRYDSAVDTSNPPRFVISADPSGGRNLELIFEPDFNGELAAPGACVVARVQQRSGVLVEVRPRQIGGSVAASVKIERLGSTPEKKQHASTKTGNLQIVAHLARRGDVAASSGDWIGGPQQPARIEGIKIDWPDCPPDLALRYSVEIGGRGQLSEPADLGNFAGTRGRALAVTGICLELSGTQDSAYALTMEAIFLGSAIARGEGKRLRFTGPTGKEPLVGLKLGIRHFPRDIAPTPSQPQQSLKRTQTKATENLRIGSGAVAGKQPSGATTRGSTAALKGSTKTSGVRVFRGSGAGAKKPGAGPPTGQEAIRTPSDGNHRG